MSIDIPNNTSVKENDQLVANCNSLNSNPPANNFVFFIDDVSVQNSVCFCYEMLTTTYYKWNLILKCLKVNKSNS